VFVCERERQGLCDTYVYMCASLCVCLCVKE